MPDQRSDRIEGLDLIRGVAVLGILAINIAGFANVPAATLSPHLPAPGSWADELAFSAAFILFEGKMRALFSLLFGAGIALFIERAEAKGAFADMLQLRRLGWLMLFGLLHFYLFWWGDILFLYAVTGIVVLLVRDLDTRTLVVTALSIFVIWHLTGMAMGASDLAAEEHVRNGTASEAQLKDYHAYLDAVEANVATEQHDISGTFIEQAAARASHKTFRPLTGVFTSMGETLPLMLLGMALYRTGFFTGGWTRRKLIWTGCVGTGAGLALTLGLLGWVWPRDFPPRAMEAIFLYGAAIPHVLMAIGYAAFLVLAAPKLARMAIGKALIAAGRMAFTNYLGTSVLMTFLFYGWGLGLFGHFGHAWLWAFVMGGWALMLGVSALWLANFRRGPLEWLWRSLIERRMLANTR